MSDTLTGSESMGVPDATPEHTGSLADYEAAIHQPAVDGTAASVAATEADENDAPEPVAETTRGADGKFKPRHRAASQQAGADDVEVIAAHTKRLREAESGFTDIVQQDGESPRAFGVRKRAEIAERAARAAKAPAPPVVPPARSFETKATDTPKKPDASEVGTKYSTYEAFTEALAEWSADRRFEAHEQERVKENRAAEARSENDRVAAAFNGRIATAKAKYPDFQVVALDAPTRIPAGSAIDMFILTHKAGPDVLYHLQQHGGELDGILTQNPMEQVEALSLLAQRLTTPTAADSTGAAPRMTSQPAPKPPTPVRGGPSRPADEPPTADDTPLSEHEKAFHTARRR